MLLIVLGEVHPIGVAPEILENGNVESPVLRQISKVLEPNNPNCPTKLTALVKLSGLDSADAKSKAPHDKPS